MAVVRAVCIGPGGLRKRPSTSELIDWIAVLKSAGIASVKLDEALPFLSTLTKKEQDLVVVNRMSKGPAKRWRR